MTFSHAAYFLVWCVKRALHDVGMMSCNAVRGSKASLDSLLFLSPDVSTLLYMLVPKRLQ